MDLVNKESASRAAFLRPLQEERSNNMKKNINLTTVEEANRFVYVANRFAGDIDIKIGRYTLDAKSLMGVLSMAVGKIGELHIIGGEEDQSTLNELLSFCM